MRIASPAIREVSEEEEAQTALSVSSRKEPPTKPGAITMATPEPAHATPKAEEERTVMQVPATAPGAESNMQVANDEAREQYLRARIKILAEVRTLDCYVASSTIQGMDSGSTTTSSYRSPRSPYGTISARSAAIAGSTASFLNHTSSLRNLLARLQIV